MDVDASPPLTAPIPRDRHMHRPSDRSQQPPERRRRAMTEDSCVPVSQNSGHPPGSQAADWVAHAVDTLVHSVQPPAPRALRNGGTTQSRHFKLTKRYHSVLLGGNCGDDRICGDGFVSHRLTKPPTAVPLPLCGRLLTAFCFRAIEDCEAGMDETDIDRGAGQAQAGAAGEIDLEVAGPDWRHRVAAAAE